mgnify:CR=1 FL=1
MKKVLMLRSGKSYLPQIEASIQFFRERDAGIQLVDSAEAEGAGVHEFDGVWTFPGIDWTKKRSIPVIHEYASLSTGLFPRWKNNVKKKLNTNPDLRIYLNEFVKEGLSFSDDVPFVYRDMGVSDDFFNCQHTVKEYDCVYVGSLSKQRGISRLLDHFKYKAKKHSLLLVGKVEDDLYQEYVSCENLTFTGDLAYKDVAKHASAAVYGINYMPDQYPYNRQTSTKLLEYAAMGLKIVTTDYFWVRHFMKQHGASFMIVDEELNGLDLSKPSDQGKLDAELFRWSNVIEDSGMEEKIRVLLS